MFLRLAAACLAPLVVAAAAAAGPAAGGRLLPAAEEATFVLLGRIEGPERLDETGFVAGLEVERALVGPVAPGETLAIGWEELARGRPPRFARGDRVLVALGFLAPGSLWRERAPKTDVRPVASGGEAFLRSPSGATVEGLARYLALPPEERNRSAGVEALARLVERADAPVAIGAVQRLADAPDMANTLSDEVRRSLEGALLDPERGLELRRALLLWISARGLAVFAPALATLTSEPGPLRGDAARSLASLPGGLPAERAEAWLASPDPELRSAALLAGGGSDASLATLSRDPAPEVRAAALARLAADPSPPTTRRLVEALEDPDPRVRETAIRALGPREDAVAALEQEALRGSDRSARAALAALARSGPRGTAALRSVADDHPDARLREAARFLLGERVERH